MEILSRVCMPGRGAHGLLILFPARGEPSTELHSRNCLSCIPHFLLPFASMIQSGKQKSRM